MGGDTVLIRDREGVLDHLDAVCWLNRVDNCILDKQCRYWELDTKVLHVVLHVASSLFHLLLVGENGRSIELGVVSLHDSIVSSSDLGF